MKQILRTFITGLFFIPATSRAVNYPWFHGDNICDTITTHAGTSFNKYWKRNFSYTGIPLCATGLIIWQQQKGFRSMRNHFVPKFNSLLDNYSQYSPLGMTLILKSCGIKTRSSWLQLTANTGISTIIMASAVNGMKYSIREIRPDYSSRNSFPSGHTATAFMCATIMHKELGDKSPWYSVSAYSVAGLTGLFRILNNRHWINDVVFGAGIGITSVDLAYVIGDLIFKSKTTPGSTTPHHSPDHDKPDFFMFGMSVGTGSNLTCPDIYDVYPSPSRHTRISQTPLHLKLKMGTVSSVSLEGAYFFNKYLGIGGEAKLSVCPIIADYNHKFEPYVTELNGAYYKLYKLKGIESDGMGMIDFRIGAYASLPLHRKWNAGCKCLIGRTYTTALSLHSYSELKKEYLPLVDVALQNGLINTAEADEIKNGVKDMDFLKISPSQSWGFTGGIHVSYQLKKATALRAYVNYSSSYPKLTYHISNRIMIHDEPEEKANAAFIEDSFQKRTVLNSLSGGVCLAVMF